VTRQIRIIVGNIETDAWLNESRTASMVWEILPVTSKASLWGDEIYFAVPVKTGLEDGRETVALGDIAYWPEGPALCIFPGKTPISTKDEIRPASAVSIVGKVRDVQALLGRVKQGDTIVIQR